MIDYRECIVPDIKLRDKVYIWVAYSKEPPHLPIALADTPRELAEKVGVSATTARCAWWKFCHGKVGRSLYHRVKIGFDLNWMEDG